LVRTRRRIDLRPLGSTTDPRDAAYGINLDATEVAQVDHDSSFAHSVSSQAVPPTANRKRQIVAPRMSDGEAYI
jgi:hypothetical protein